MNEPVDIVVTIPVARLAEVESEEREVAARLARGDGGWQYFWEMGRVPVRRVRRIYFAWAGAVRAWHEVLNQLPPGEIRLEEYVGTVERDATRGAIFMDPEIHEIAPIPMRPFRGFRYFNEATARG